TATVTETAVTPEVHQPLDLGLNFATQVALDLAIRLDDATNGRQLLFVEIIGADRLADSGLVEDRSRRRVADPVDVGQRDDDTLVAREVDASYACHVSPASACVWGCRR